MVILRPLLSRLVRQTPLRWHLPNRVTRIEVIQRAIDAIGATRYLEIGVAEGDCFCSVRVAERIGVDPIQPTPAVFSELAGPGTTYHAVTSDDFFNHDAPQVLAQGIDVVFIDGLHTYPQAYRDCTNALRYLNQGGVIFMHDCCPVSATEAQPAVSYEDAQCLNGPEWGGLWTGDGWKAIVALRAGHEDLDAFVLDCDHGVGMVYRRHGRRGLAYTPEEVDAMTYDDLVRDRRRLLGLRAPRHLFDSLRGLAGERG